jgi:hypothetical protein
MPEHKFRERWVEMAHGEMLLPGQADLLALESTPDWARPIVQAAVESRLS